MKVLLRRKLYVKKKILKLNIFKKAMKRIKRITKLY